MRRLSTLVAALLLSGVLSGNEASVSAAPSQTQLYWGAVIKGPAYGFGSVPDDMRAVQVFEAHAGKAVSIIPFGGPWVSSTGAFQPFDTVGFENIRQHGSIPLFSWESDGGSWSSFTNATITAGTYDAYLHTWARAAKAWGHPFFLRFDHEMDGWWYPWAEGSSTVGGPITNGNTPGSYVAMYRHVHDIFTQEGATNATWIWCVNWESTTGRYPPLSQIYPGDDYVDWTGMDAYNLYPGDWLTFDEMIGGYSNPLGDPLADTYQLVLNVAPSKPMMIPELATVENPNDPNAKPGWLRDTFITQLVRNFPAIRAVLYFNWGIDGTTTPIESSPASQAAFANSISLSTYATNTFGLLGGRRIPPPAEQVAYLTSVADTSIASEAPTSTAGGFAPTLSVSGSPTQTHDALLRFELTSLLGKHVDQAVLQLSTASDADAGSTGTINVKYDANNSWKEAYTSWVNHGGPWDVSPTPIATFVSPVQPSTPYVAVLPTSLVSAHLGGQLSMQLDTTATDAFAFASREAADPNVRPQLVIAYH